MGKQLDLIEVAAKSIQYSCGDLKGATIGIAVCCGMIKFHYCELTIKRFNEVLSKVNPRSNFIFHVAIKNINEIDKQKDFQFIGKDFNGKYHVGFVFVDKPWYQPESQYRYYIRFQRYTDNYGSSHWVEEEVEKDSIVPFNICSEIALHLIKGDKVEVE